VARGGSEGTVEFPARDLSETRFRALVEHASDLILCTDGHAVMTYVSPDSERILGYPPESGIGRVGFDFLHPDDRPAAVAAFAKIVANPGLAEPIELRAVHADGSLRDLEMIANNLLDDPTVGVVVFHVRDITEPGWTGRYDLPRPVEALRAMRGLCADGGTVLIVDERVEDQFTAPGGELERLFYGFSTLCCLPTGMAEQPSAATGTVMRPATLRSYALAADFRRRRGSADRARPVPLLPPQALTSDPRRRADALQSR